MTKNGEPLPDLSPAELVVMLASRDPASDIVDFPINNQLVLDRAGKPVERIRMCILKAREKIQCKTEASRLVRAQFKADYRRDPTADDMSAFDMQNQYDDLFACELLVRACRSEKRINGADQRAVYAAIFESSAWLIDNLTSDEIGILFQLYLTTELKVGAREQVLDDDPITLKRWVDKLKQGMWALRPLAPLASADLGELVRGLSKLVSTVESYGFPILDPQYLSLLSSSSADQANSTGDMNSFGEPQESFIPTTISPEKARELAASMRGKPR